MTNIGIAFVNAQEVIRSNRAQEALKHESNVIEAFKAQEAQRHNIVTENVSMRDVQVKERAQSLQERRYYEIDVPMAQSQMSVNRSIVRLNAAKSDEARASARLKSEQLFTEIAKQEQERAKANYYGARADLAHAQANESKLNYYFDYNTVNNRIDYTNATKNYYTGIANGINTIYAPVEKVVSISTKVGGFVASLF